MIPNKVRESRRVKALKLPKNFERLYKEGKCRECSVVVTRMNFAKILGKFTKVKIQYESSTSPKTKDSTITSPTSRLKNNENGMVLLPRKAYNQHPVKQLLGPKKPNDPTNDTSTPRKGSNVLKENNRLKKNSQTNKLLDNTLKKSLSFNTKHYGIIFMDPLTNNINKDSKNIISLEDLWPNIDDSILPTYEWIIDYFPKNEEPKDDKVYDRIAAELEDLMYNEKASPKGEEKSASPENKIDEFPSIMDILNDNSNEIVQKSNDQSNSIEFKPNLESSDVEAMLLGKSEEEKPSESNMEVDNTDVQKLIEDVNQLHDIPDSSNLPEVKTVNDVDNPQSPSILEEIPEKSTEDTQSEELVKSTEKLDTIVENIIVPDVPLVTPILDDNTNAMEVDENKNTTTKTPTKPLINISSITEVIFKKMEDGVCCKSVRCPKNLKYSIVLNGKSVEFLGAPKFISSLEDLQVLLQIVNESELKSIYVLQ